VVAETQRSFIYPACQLDNDALDELAVVLVEFDEDIHAGIGLWQALENYQSEFFGTPLPLFLEVDEQLAGRFDPRRVRHFLYILLTEAVSEFLIAAFRQQPKDSGVARFLHTPNRRGWDIKRKLVWAGRHSYLFRDQCARYLEEQRTGTTDFNAIDEFICQHCTDWCGLGVIDLLAAALDLSEPDRATLRTWYERHNAPYHVIEIVKRGAVAETTQVINVVNDQPYCIRIEMQKCPFAAGQIVLIEFLLLMGDSGECWCLRFCDERPRIRLEECGSWKSRSSRGALEDYCFNPCRCSAKERLIQLWRTLWDKASLP
jgi:hypothetical protein